MRRRSLLQATAILALPSLRPPAAAGQGVPLVFASFSILGDMVRRVAGDRVRLEVLAGPETDAHRFQPRPSELLALREAVLVVRNGLGFDGFVDRMLRSAGWRGRVVTATEGIAPRSMAGHAPGRGAVPDPHAWQDLRLGVHYVRRIAEGLAAADPPNAAAHVAAAETYVTRLEELDAWVRAQVATVPEARRKVVTSHDAFGYFGDAYGITFLAPQGVSTEAEPSAAQVARLIRQVRAEGITAVFLENMASPVALERLAQEAGVRVRGRLYADALSAPEGPAPSYEAMFRHNIGLLVPAMRGEGA
jgi:zinc/manganese transport system substrate-binding protein